MGIRIGSIVFNCADLDRMTTFWAEALGLGPYAGNTGEAELFRVLEGSRVNMSLQRAATPVSARDQAHLDLYSDDQAAEVARLVALGATVVRHEHDDPDDDFVVMTDPEGNEFCVCAVSSSAM